MRDGATAVPIVTEAYKMSGELIVFGGREVRVIDLSQRLSNATSEFEPMPHAIEYFDHRDTIPIAEEKFGLGAEHWRDGLDHMEERPTACRRKADAPHAIVVAG